MAIKESAASIVPLPNRREGSNLLTKVEVEMRKIRKQQKTEEATQLKLEVVSGNLVFTGTDGISNRDQSRAELISRLKQQKTLTTNILERIVDYGNLDKAYRQVKKNKGNAGVDEMSIPELRDWLGTHYQELQEDLLEENYNVGAVKKVEIPKTSGGKRLLGIPTVKDRMVQQAIHQELNRHYEPYFSDYSFGFRPGRNAWQAIEQASEYVSQGYEWVVDIDMEKFFDKINHDRLMQRLSKGIGDKRLLRLINSYLKTGIMVDGLVEQRIAGTPQGSPLSPLLSNIVLDELDMELEKRGHKFCRYADDCNIFVRSKQSGERVLSSLIKFIEGKLKLKVNKEKSGVGHCSKVKFLGYTVMPEGKIRTADKSIERLKGKLKEITKRNRGVKLEQVIEEVNRVIIGWTNYFYLSNCWLSDYRGIDSWLRRKLRCYRLKQCDRKYTIFKFLRSFDLPVNSCWNAIMYSQGWWVMSNKATVRKAMGIRYFNELGLQSFTNRMSDG